MILCVWLTLFSCAANKMNSDTDNKDPEMQDQWSGHVDKEAVRKVIHENLHAIKNCYINELKTHQNVRGKVLVEFEINDRGLIKSVQIKKTTLNNKPVEECVTSVIAKAHFPPSPEGKTAVITYPFLFDNSK